MFRPFILALSLFVVACGGSDSKDAPSQAQAPEEQEQEPVEIPEETEEERPEPETDVLPPQMEPRMEMSESIVEIIPEEMVPPQMMLGSRPVPDSAFDPEMTSRAPRIERWEVPPTDWNGECVSRLNYRSDLGRLPFIWLPEVYPLNVYVDVSSFDAFTAMDQYRGISDAFDLWEPVGMNIGTMRFVSNPDDADVVVNYEFQPESSALGVARLRATERGFAVSGSVTINTAFVALDTRDLIYQQTTVHEVGHILGVNGGSNGPGHSTGVIEGEPFLEIMLDTQDNRARMTQVDMDSMRNVYCRLNRG